MPLAIRCFGEGEASSQSLTSPAAPWILRGRAARTNSLKTQVGGWCVCSRGESGVIYTQTRLLVNRDVTTPTASGLAFIGKLRQILRGCRACTVPDTKGTIAARPIEHRLRFRLGYQSLSTPHNHDSRRNRRPCILPTLAPRPISSEVRGQRRFLCPERFPELMAISLLVCFAAQGK